MFTTIASSFGARALACVTMLSLLLGAFPASFFIANAQSLDNTEQTQEPLQVETQAVALPPEDIVIDEKKVTICKATASENNPYVKVDVSVKSLEGGHGNNGINENDIVPPTEPTFPAGHNWNTETEAIFKNNCTVPEPVETVTVNAAKIICTDEAELPNWGNGGPDITSTTAVDWVRDHQSCSLVKGWEFQWGNQSAPNFGDSALGPAPSYTTFTNSTVIPINGVSEIHLREVLQPGYLAFSHEANPDNSNTVSAEFYCADDVLNYDNWDFIRNPIADKTYYCVAWNVPVAGEPTECRIGENLIDNGGFEAETVTDNSGQWQIFATVAGWIVGMSDGLEIWNTFNGTNNDVAAEGNQNAELDGNDATSITQTVATTPGATYELSYKYSPRAGTVMADSKMEALINDTVVDTQNADGSSAVANAWQSKSHSFVATGTSTKVSFRDAGMANENGGYGPLLDGVALCKTKEAPRCDLTIVSDTQTLVEDTNTLAVATYSGNSAWTASVPGATWIWETATVTDPVNATTRTFVETFTITAPTSANLKIAADNGYQVFLNNVLVVDNLAVENNFQSGTQDNIPLTLASGANTLKVVVENFPMAGADYKSNPAGVLFKLTAVGATDCNRTTEVVKTGPVTMCKVDTNERPLAGWTMTLLGNKVEDVVVPTNSVTGVNTIAILTAGKSYVAKASGTWNNQGGANPADAEYSTTDGWTTWVDGYLPYTSYSTDILELQINSAFDPNSNWGAYNSGHTYAQAFTQAANGTANFRIFDGTGTTQNPDWFGDNSGTLGVSVYEGFAGITGENGCVTFKNVPFGTYTAGEIMQDNWTNVSGLGEVKVSKKNNKFTLVNKFEPRYTDETIEIDVTGNTLTSATGTGWFFSGAPFTFQAGNASRGSGSLFAGPIDTVPASKLIGMYQGFMPVNTLSSVAFDFKIASNTAADYDDFYLNVYANFGASAPTKFYDCRYDVVPSTGSLSSFTTLNYAATDAKLAQQGTASPFACPPTLAEMETLSPGAVVRAITLNMGQSNNSDAGVSGYFDNVIIKTQNDTLLQKKTTIFDFEPTPKPNTYTISGYKYQCDDDGDWICYGEDGLAGWTITLSDEDGVVATTTTNSEGFYSFTVGAGEWMVSEETRANWEQVKVVQNGQIVIERSTCTFDFGGESAVSLVTTPSIKNVLASGTCDFHNGNNSSDTPESFTISGFKWNDADGNGLRAVSEATLANWVIGLYSGETLLATTSTNNAGFYSFTVKPGTWTVAEIQQTGWTQTGTLKNNTPVAAPARTCTFTLGLTDERRLADTGESAALAQPNSCDFGNQQNQVITDETPTRSSSGRSSTRVRNDGPEGQVLGAATSQCGLWIEDFMQKATENDRYQVLKLQVFLNLQGLTTPLTGVFDTVTEDNVKQFQMRYFEEIIKPWFDRGIVPHSRPTGFVYKTTRWKINDIMCPGIEPYPSFEGETLTTNVLLSR